MPACIRSTRSWCRPARPAAGSCPAAGGEDGGEDREPHAGRARCRASSSSPPRSRSPPRWPAQQQCAPAPRRHWRRAAGPARIRRQHQRGGEADPAPALTPSTSGPASGLPVSFCMIAPAAPSSPPAAGAATTRGARTPEAPSAAARWRGSSPQIAPGDQSEQPDQKGRTASPASARRGWRQRRRGVVWAESGGAAARRARQQPQQKRPAEQTDRLAGSG